MLTGCPSLSGPSLSQYRLPLAFPAHTLHVRKRIMSPKGSPRRPPRSRSSSSVHNAAESKHCSKCHQFLEISNFLKSTDDQKLLKLCLECRAKQRKRTHRRKRLLVHDIHEASGSKQCSKCYETVEVSNFLNPTNNTGELFKWCGQCRAKDRESQRKYKRKTSVDW